MKLRRIVSCMMALLLVCSLPVSAFAAEYDLAQGSVIVNATETGQTVTHGSNAAVPDSAPVITQSNSSTPTTNTITITATENATANVTIQDVNIVISDPTGNAQNHSGEAAVTIDVADGAEANVTLDGVKINVGGTGGHGYRDIYFSGEAAVQIVGNGDVTMELDGDNTVQSGYYRAGVEKNDADSSGSLTITDENGTDGSLEATGGDFGAGIGGGSLGSGSDITITGSAEVTATGGKYGAGIGGGGSVIGSGGSGSGSNIKITGSAEVTAKGGNSGSGIGGGYRSTGSYITVSEDAQVKAQGGNAIGALGAGAAIGDGGAKNQTGVEKAVTTDSLNEGWIATYAPDITDLDTTPPSSLTYQVADGTVQTVTESITVLPAQSATDNTHEQKAGFKVGDVEVAVKTHRYGNYQSDDNATCTHDGTESAKCTVPGCTAKLERTIPGTMLDHEYGDYIPDANNLATCTKAGTKTAMCKHCTATDTVPDPIKEHSFTNYISDGNATYEKDGTKTAKCDHCDATDTIPDPGSKLVREAPLYRVVGQDGKALACEKAQSSGVLTIEVDADFATLTGNPGGLKTLKAQGVETIVFVTTGATSTFALADLLAQVPSGSTYALTHVGSTVTLTLSSGEDISSILK